MKIYLISYATKEFESFQYELHESESTKNFIHKKYSPSDIEESFRDKNKNILERKRGGGYWLWKPYLIFKTLKEVEYGDIVIYVDSGDGLHNDLESYIIEKLEDKDSVLLMGLHRHETWCKRICFELMDCDEPKYRNSRQLEAGFMAFKKNKKNLELVENWLNFCENSDIITDDFVGNEVFNFRDHRHDQAILTNIVLKNGIETVDIGEIYKYVNFNQKVL
jgi:hypothetical protein